jgi:hypothetical protein
MVLFMIPMIAQEVAQGVFMDTGPSSN